MYLSISRILFLHSYSDVFCVLFKNLFHNNVVKTIEIYFVRRFLYCINNYYIFLPMFCWQVHVIAMFNLCPITVARMTIATNDVVLQNMFMLTNNIMPCKTCLKPWGRIFNKCAKNFFCFNTWGTNLGRFIY